MTDEANLDIHSQVPYAAVVYTGRHQQMPGQSLRCKWVQSRYFLRCLSGEGEAVINDETISLRAGVGFLSPWNHSYVCESSRSNPLLIVGLHLIPDYQPPGDFIYLSNHDPENPFEDHEFRNDAPIELLDGLQRFRFTEEAPIHVLGDYIMSWFQSGRRHDWQSRHMAQLLLQALVDKRRYRPKHAPIQVRQVIETFYRKIDYPWTIPELAGVAKVSTATLHRLFKQHTGLAPAAWMQERRIRHAAHLVISTKLPLGEIGRRVGVPDPYYFSKQFQRFMGMSARQYRKERGNTPPPLHDLY